MNTFLSPKEIHQLTGLVRPSAQVRWLNTKRNIPAFVNAANQAVVYRSWLEQGSDMKPTAAMPDFDAMDDVA